MRHSTSHLVLLAAAFLVVLQDVVPHVVLRVDEQLLRVSLLFPPLDPHDEQQDHGCERSRTVSSVCTHGRACAYVCTGVNVHARPGVLWAYDGWMRVGSVFVCVCICIHCVHDIFTCVSACVHMCA